MSEALDRTYVETLPSGGCAVRNGNGHAHSFDDEPALIVDNVLYHRKDGVLHREGDKPAVTRPNGQREWYKESRRHRVGGPAIVYADGRTEFWRNGGRVDAIRQQLAFHTMPTGPGALQPRYAEDE